MYGINAVSSKGIKGWELAGPEGQKLVVSSLGGRVCRLDLGPAFSGLVGPCAAVDPEEEKIRGSLGLDPWFSGCVLFPFNDRIPGGRYAFAGQEHQLQRNAPEDGSAIHGFLYRRRMSLRDQGCDQAGAWLELGNRIEAGDEPGYPFDMTITVRYRLADAGFSLHFAVENSGPQEAPFSLGWHPYFSLGGNVEQWHLQMDSPAYVPVGPDLMPLGKARAGEQAATGAVAGTVLDFRQSRTLAGQAYDMAMVMPDDARLVLAGPGGEMVMQVQSSQGGWRYFQVFVPPDRRSIALEPITAATNAFNQSELGLQVLPPGAVWRGGVDLSVFAS